VRHKPFKVDGKMNKAVRDYLSQLRLGELQNWKNMAIVPLFAGDSEELDYMTLKDALEEKAVTVTEVDDSGSVPNLKITNESDILVLLLDGEEVTGAKQNRILNVSILLNRASETVIPVSCTEQGRWSYTSRKFAYSDVLMSPKARSRKSAAVHASLRRGEGCEADQGEIWDGIEEMQCKMNFRSSTRAMKDVYESRSRELDNCLQAFKCLPGQVGSLVFVNGEVVGLDIIPDDSKYGKLHPQFIKSYAMEGLLEEDKKGPQASKEKAEAFLEVARQSKESHYDAVGLGTDYRYENEKVLGFALVHDSHPVHVAFFNCDKGKEGRERFYRD